MKYNLSTRRMFLQGAGRLLPMPFLVSLLPKELWGQSSAPIRRFISIQSNYDYGHHRAWFPALTQPAQTLQNGGDQTLRYAPLRSYLANSTAPLSTVFGNHLNQHLNQINLFRGLDFSSSLLHAQGHLLGNPRAYDGGLLWDNVSHIRTIDQVLRSNTTFNPINRDVAVLGNAPRVSWRGSGSNIVAVPPLAESAGSIYNYLFNGGSVPESGGGSSSTQHPRYDLLTGVMADYNRIKNGGQISGEERVSLDSALDSLSDLQRSLASSQVTTGACQYRSIPRVGNGVDFFRSDLTLKAYADLITAAVMCDITRIFVVGLRLNEYGAYDTSPSSDFHQGVSHEPFTVTAGRSNWENMARIQNDLVRNLISPLLNGLAGAVDPSNSQTYLYNSLVHYSVESSIQHSGASVPAFLAGNAGGNITSGYFMDYTNRSVTYEDHGFSSNPSASNFSHNYPGVPYNRLFNTILQGMGLSPSDYEDASINTYFQNRTDSRFGAINNNIARMGGYGHWGPFQTDSWTAPLYANYNLRYFKDRLLMPTTSAT